MLCTLGLPMFHTRDPGIGVALLDLQKPFGGAQVGRGAHAHVLRADLLEEQQLFVCGFGGGLRAELDAGSTFVD
jgi:hypothetical protein